MLACCHPDVASLDWHLETRTPSRAKPFYYYNNNKNDNNNCY